MTSILDPDLMRTLVHIHEEGSFTKAGERLGLTQQAVSAHVKRIEAAVTRPIVSRRGSRVQLTPDGEALLMYARQAMDISERVRRHFSATQISGKVRIGILEGFASFGLPVLLASLQSIQPTLEISVETGFTERLVLRQDNGRLDVVLGAQRRGQPRGERLWDDHLRWVGDLEPYRDAAIPVRLALPPEPSLVRTIALEALAKVGRPYAVVFESESRASLRAAALSGMGATVFCAFDEEPPSVEAEPVLPTLETIEYFLRTAEQLDDALGDIARLIREAVRSVLRDHAASAMWIS